MMFHAPLSEIRLRCKTLEILIVPVFIV